MVSEVVAGLNIFKSMMEMAKGLKDVNDATVRNAVAIELQEKILTAQQSQNTLLERIGELEKALAQFETWETEKKRYHLYDFGGDTFAYILKEGMENGEPSHRLCANCFQKGLKSILQNTGRNTSSQDTFDCKGCGEKFQFGNRQLPKVNQGKRLGSWMSR